MRERISELDKSAISLIANTHTHMCRPDKNFDCIGKDILYHIIIIQTGMRKNSDDKMGYHGVWRCTSSWFQFEWDDEVHMLIIAHKGQKTNPNRRHGETDKTSGKCPVEECCWAQTRLPSTDPAAWWEQQSPVESLLVQLPFGYSIWG